MSFNFSPKVITDGLVLYLDAANARSYPGTGASWYDLSRTQNNATLMLGPTYTTDNGGSIILDGTDDYVRVSAFGTLTDFTISSWFKMTGAGAGAVNQYGTVFGAPNNRILVETGTNKWVLAQMGGSNYVSTTQCPFNVWHNVVYTYNSTTDIAQLYVNNIKQTPQLNASPVYTNVDHYIGIYSLITPDYLLKGNVAITSIYNRPLSDNEVDINYNAVARRFRT